MVSSLLAATGHLQVPSSVQIGRSESLAPRSAARLDSKVQETTSKTPFYLGTSRGRSFSLAMQSSEQVQRTKVILVKESKTAIEGGEVFLIKLSSLSVLMTRDKPP